MPAVISQIRLSMLPLFDDLGAALDAGAAALAVERERRRDPCLDAPGGQPAPAIRVRGHAIPWIRAWSLSMPSSFVTVTGSMTCVVPDSPV